MLACQSVILLFLLSLRPIAASPLVHSTPHSTTTLTNRQHEQYQYGLTTEVTQQLRDVQLHSDTVPTEELVEDSHAIQQTATQQQRQSHTSPSSSHSPPSSPSSTRKRSRSPQHYHSHPHTTSTRGRSFERNKHKRSDSASSTSTIRITSLTQQPPSRRRKAKNQRRQRLDNDEEIVNETDKRIMNDVETVAVQDSHRLKSKHPSRNRAHRYTSRPVSPISRSSSPQRSSSSLVAHASDSENSLSSGDSLKQRMKDEMADLDRDLQQYYGSTSYYNTPHRSHHTASRSISPQRHSSNDQIATDEAYSGMLHEYWNAVLRPPSSPQNHYHHDSAQQRQHHHPQHFPASSVKTRTSFQSAHAQMLDEEPWHHKDESLIDDASSVRHMKRS